MKFTIGWLKEHLDTRFKDNEIIEFDAKPTKENLEAFMEEITKN